MTTKVLFLRHQDTKFFFETVKSNKKLNIFKFFRSNNEFNLLSKDSVRGLLKFMSPDIIVNFIGLTDVIL